MSVDKILEHCAEEQIALSIENGKLNVKVTRPPKNKSVLLELIRMHGEIERVLLDKQCAPKYGGGGHGSRDHDQHQELIPGGPFDDPADDPGLPQDRLLLNSHWGFSVYWPC